MKEDLLSVASDIVAKARALGADEADAYLRSGVESTVSIRKQAMEKLIEAGSQSVSIRVIKDKRTAVCNTSDLTPKALDEMVRTAVELAKISEPDEFAGLPAREDLATDMGGALMLYDERIESLTVDEMRDIVMRAEQAAFDADKRVTNSEGAEFGAERGLVVLANSIGFAGSFPYTAASFSVSVLADEAEDRRAKSRDARGPGRVGIDHDRRPHGHRGGRGQRRVAVPSVDVSYGLRRSADRIAAGEHHRRCHAAGAARLATLRRRGRTEAAERAGRRRHLQAVPLRQLLRTEDRAADDGQRVSHGRSDQRRHGQPDLGGGRDGAGSDDRRDL